jgi:hypothetical protein
MRRSALLALVLLLALAACSDSSDPGPTPTSAPTSTASGPPSKASRCLDSPSSCGYPDQTNSGVVAGSALKQVTGNVILSSAGATYSDALVHGWIAITADNVTVRNVQVITSAATQDQTTAPWGIKVSGSNDVIENVSIGGSDGTTNAVEYAIFNASSTLVARHDYLYNCTECYAGPGTLTDSFVHANGTFPAGHIEGTYYGGGEGPLTISHNTILGFAESRSHPATAAIYAYSDHGVVRNLAITNNLLSGGAYTIYGGGPTATGVAVTNNRFGRNYFAKGGLYGVLAYYPPDITWSGNVWDGSGQRVPK